MEHNVTIKQYNILFVPTLYIGWKYKIMTIARIVRITVVIYNMYVLCHRVIIVSIEVHLDLCTINFGFWTRYP